MAMAHGACTGRAEGAEQAHPPVADLVAEALDHDGPVVGHHAGGLDLLRPGTAARCWRPRRRGRSGRGGVPRRPGRRQLPHLAQERAERPAELQRAPGPVAVPERHLARLAGRRRHHHPLEADVLDPPGGRPEQEGLARPALVHHLLVELADPGAVGQEHAEQPAVGDGAAAGDGQPAGTVAGAQLAADAVPHDAGAQLAELLARVAAGQQVEHVDEQVVGEVGEGGAAADEGGQLVDRARRHGRWATICWASTSSGLRR